MKNRYMMTEAQIESLAAERTTSLVLVDGLDGTYLRAVVTGVQAALGRRNGKRQSDGVQLEAIEGVTVPYYAAVLRGVVTDDIELTPELDAAEVSRRTRERNRRATFARTAKSTLVAWVKAGGDVRTLDAATLTKTQLRAQAVTTTNRVERAQDAILSAVAREEPDKARETLERVIAVLQAALDELPDAEAAHGNTAVMTGTGATFAGHMRRVPGRIPAAA